MTNSRAGSPGSKGDTGEKGSMGPSGERGVAGPKGDRGASGKDGSKGDRVSKKQRTEGEGERRQILISKRNFDREKSSPGTKESCQISTTLMFPGERTDDKDESKGRRRWRTKVKDEEELLRNIFIWQWVVSEQDRR